MKPKTIPGSSSREKHQINRRLFIAGSGAVSLSISLVKPSGLRSYQTNSKINLGIIGCGMRGKWITDLFVKHGGYKISAAADYFQDKVDEFGEQFGIPENNRFTTLSGYKRLLEKDLDAVVIESPPYFHPEQTEAALNAGKHVFLAKPIAVDVPGTVLISYLGREASINKLCLLVDFQTRTNHFYKEAVSRVYKGDIGRIGFGEAAFNGGDVWNTWNPIGLFLKEKPGDPEARLRAWGLDRELSGDILVEQCIHSIDVATWILDSHPVTAYGTGGRNHYEY
jgi:predicted dehydrogenase